MSKENTTVKIKASSPELAKVVFGYLKSNEGQIKQSLDTFLRGDGRGMTDVTFENSDPDKLTLTITDNPTDKGDVFVLNSDGEISIVRYTDLEVGEFYGYMEGGKNLVYRLEESFDTPFNVFNKLGDLSYLLKELPPAVKAQEDKQKELSKNVLEKTIEETIEDAEIIHEPEVQDAEMKVNEDSE